MAQATIYGRIDVGYGNKQATSGAGGKVWSQNGISDGAITSNAIGFDATDDLGRGMKARVVTEWGYSPTTNAGLGAMRTATAGAQLEGYAGATGLNDSAIGGAGGYSTGTNRQTFAEIGGGFGRVRAGYMRTHLYELATFSGATMTTEGAVGGQAAHVWGAAWAGGTRGNTIEWQLPKMGNVTVGLQTGSGGGREETSFGSAASNTASGVGTAKAARSSLKVDWAEGPAAAGLVYTTYNQSTTAKAANCSAAATTTNDSYCTYNVFGALSALPLTAATVTYSGTSEYTTNLMQLAGSYNFGAIKVGANINRGTYNLTSVTTPSVGTAPAVASGTGVASYDIASQGISFNMPMGAMELFGGMGTASQSTGSTNINNISTSQVGLIYNFSKRTRIYGIVGNLKDQVRVDASAATVAYMTQTIAGINVSF
ncbi:Porin domain, Gram-negative type [Burkholderiaceae bacterium]